MRVIGAVFLTGGAVRAHLIEAAIDRVSRDSSCPGPRLLRRPAYWIDVRRPKTLRVFGNEPKKLLSIAVPRTAGFFIGFSPGFEVSSRGLPARTERISPRFSGLGFTEGVSSGGANSPDTARLTEIWKDTNSFEGGSQVTENVLDDMVTLAS